MKKQFENIDDLTRFKINTLHDEDIEVNESLIWGKIEEQLDKKTKIRIFAWRKIAAVACLILLLGGSILVMNDERIIENTEIKTPKSTVTKMPLITKKEVKNNSNYTDNQHITYKNRKRNIVKEEKLKLSVGQIEQPKLMIIETPVVAFKFKPIEIPQTLTQVSQKTPTTKMRVMHINEYEAETSEVFIKPKTFYVQTDIQNIIKSQTPTIPYAFTNISN